MSNFRTIASVLVAASLSAGCAAHQPAAEQAPPDTTRIPSVLANSQTPRPPFHFSPEDQLFLEQVQHGAFNFLYHGAVPQTGMVPDRSSGSIVSVAGVGFQLAALCIGVEHAWITREQGQARALQILDVLARDAAIRHEGLFQHFLDGKTGGRHSDKGMEHVVSTTDTAWLFSGMLVASQYFAGDVQTKADEIFAQANWNAFLSGNEAKPHERGYISLGWRSPEPARAGGMLPFYWADSGCEHRVVTFLAVCAPRDEFRIDPATYYKLRRPLGDYADIGPMVYLPFSGALFTAAFSHCFIDYAAMGPDDPTAFGFPSKPRVDWWENSRRLTRLHQVKCAENPKKLPTLGENAWGLTASDYPGGYQVPGLFPNPIAMPWAIPEFDYAVFFPREDYGDGTIAPYGAGSAIMFDPVRSLAALRHYRSLTGPDGQPLAWRDPASGGYGFLDAFRVGRTGETPWVDQDCLAIDQGPMLVAIENARTGLIWKLFHAHPYVKEGAARVKWVIRR